MASCDYGGMFGLGLFVGFAINVVSYFVWKMFLEKEKDKNPGSVNIT